MNLSDSLSAVPWWVICFFLTLILFLPIYFVIKLFGFGKPEDSSMVAGSGEIPGSRRELIRELDQATDFFKRVLDVMYLTVAVALCAAGIYCWRIADVGNGLMIVAMLLVGLGLGTFLKILQMRPSVRQWMWPSFHAAMKASPGHPTAFRLGNDALTMARQLQNEGTDLETICRAVNPDYTHSSPMQQQTFRLVLETVLETEPARDV